MKRDKLDWKVSLVNKDILMIKLDLVIKNLISQVLVKLSLLRQVTNPKKRK